MTPGGALPASTLRSLDAGAMLERVRPLLAEHGITRIADVTGLDRLGIPVVMVTRPNGRTLSVAQGKGVTLDDARASGVMEAIETDVAERWTPDSLRSERDDLGGASVGLDELPRHPQAAGSSSAVRWVAGDDLLSGDPTWVPLERCRLDATTSAGMAPPPCAQDSNGLASGADGLDAIIHALCEVLERDARAHLGGDALLPPVLDVTALGNDTLDALLVACEAAGVDVELVDLTGVAGVPVVGCTLVDRGLGRLPPLRPMRGHGCHPDPAGAAVRALTEAAQSRLTVISGARDDLDPRHWLAVPAASAPRRVDGRVPPALLHDGTREGIAAALVRAAAAAGARRVVAVDMTPAGAPFAVVRIIAPGLAGIAEVASVERAAAA